ncbi:18957_t:CDS:1, partial [Gigaspora margarita]
NFNFVVNKAKSFVGKADLNNFCITPTYTATVTSFTSIVTTLTTTEELNLLN